MNSLTCADDAVPNKNVYYDVPYIRTKQEAEPKPIPVESLTKTLYIIEIIKFIDTRLLLKPNDTKHERSK